MGTLMLSHNYHMWIFFRDQKVSNILMYQMKHNCVIPHMLVEFPKIYPWHRAPCRYLDDIFSQAITIRKGQRYIQLLQNMLFLFLD